MLIGSPDITAGKHRNAPDRSKKIPAQLDRFLTIFLTFPRQERFYEQSAARENDKHESQTKNHERRTSLTSRLTP
jgi:hypothetical protein